MLHVLFIYWVVIKSVITNDYAGIHYKTRSKLGCVVRMVVGSILSHADFGLNDHRKDAPLFTSYRNSAHCFL